MDTAVCVMCLLCCLGYGYSSPYVADNVTLVLSNKACHENINSSDIAFKLEPVSYGEVSDLENKILKLLSNSDTVRLADYGVIRSLSLKCYKSTENQGNKKRISDIKNNIISAMENPKHSKQNVLKRKDAFIGYLPSMCVFVPLSASDMISCFEEAEDMHCSRDHSTDITIQSSDIYMYIIASEFKQDTHSFHVLCSYVIRNTVKTELLRVGACHRYHKYDLSSDSGEVSLRYSHCGLPNNGTLCYSDSFTVNNETCKPIDSTHFKKPVCVINKRPGCWYQVCPDRYFDAEEHSWLRKSPGYRYSTAVNDAMRRSTNLYNIYATDRQKITSLDVYKVPNNNTMCISLTRYEDGLFVNTTPCNTEMQFICKNIPYNIPYNNTYINETFTSNVSHSFNDNVGHIEDHTFTDNDDHTLSITITSVGVSVFIILATVLVILIVKRYFKRRSDTSTVGIHFGGGNVTFQFPNAGSTPGSAETGDGDSCTGSVPGSAGTDDDDSCTGSVPGMNGTDDGNSCTGSVPGAAWTCDSDSWGGEVHGRTASGHINSYSNA